MSITSLSLLVRHLGPPTNGLTLYKMKKKHNQHNQPTSNTMIHYGYS